MEKSQKRTWRSFFSKSAALSSSAVLSTGKVVVRVVSMVLGAVGGVFGSFLKGSGSVSAEVSQEEGKQTSTTAEMLAQTLSAPKSPTTSVDGRGEEATPSETYEVVREPESPTTSISASAPRSPTKSEEVIPAEKEIDESLDIDIMLGAISDANVQAARKRAKSLVSSDPSSAAYIYCLLIEREDTEVIGEAREHLVGHLLSLPSFSSKQNSEIKLGRTYYTLYNLLASSKLDSSATEAFKGSVAFLNPERHRSLQTDAVINAMFRAAQEYKEAIPEMEDEVSRDSITNVADSFVVSGIPVRKTRPKKGTDDYDSNLKKFTYLLAYYTASMSAPHRGFMEKVTELAGMLNSSENPSLSEEKFLCIYRINGYKKTLEDDYKETLKKEKTKIKYLGKDVSAKAIKTVLEGIKKEYFASRHPFIDSSMKFVLDPNDDSSTKISLESSPPSFDEQMKSKRLNWKLETIIKLAQRGRLPEAFLAKFSDGGLCLLRDHVYPGMIVGANTGIPATAEEILSLLASEAKPEQQVQFLQNTIAFMASDLRGKPIRRNQITGILAILAKALSSGNPAYIIQNAGAGKTAMARFAATCMLRGVPFIIFVSPVREQRPGITHLTSLDQLANAKPSTDGKPQEFFVTPREYAGMLAEKGCEKHVARLQQGLQILDEFDSGCYSIASNLRIQDWLFKNHITRIVNMSATDNLVKLDIRLKRKMSKLEEIASTADTKQRGRLQVIEKALADSIEEIGRHITDEINRPIEIVESLDDGACTANIAPGKSVLVMYPDSSDDTATVDSLVQKHSADDTVVLFRRDGQLFAHYNNGNEKTFDQFKKEFNVIAEGSRPKICCLYTVDSRGGDFEEFSRELVSAQYMVCDTVPSTTEFYQRLRRWRIVPDKDRKGILVNLQLTEKAKSELGNRITREHFLAIARKKDAVASNQQAMTWLKEKIASKMRKVVERALYDDLDVISAELEKIQLGNREKYIAAVKEALDKFYPNTESELDEQYTTLRQEVKKIFLKKANAASPAVQLLEDKCKILEGMSTDAIWKAKELCGKKFVWLTLWVAYVRSKIGRHIDERIAFKYGVELGIFKEEAISFFRNHEPTGTQLNSQSAPSIVGKTFSCDSDGEKYKTARKAFAEAMDDTRKMASLGESYDALVGSDFPSTTLKSSKEYGAFEYYKHKIKELKDQLKLLEEEQQTAGALSGSHDTADPSSRSPVPAL